jgi:hypothetical protein
VIDVSDGAADAVRSGDGRRQGDRVSATRARNQDSLTARNQFSHRSRDGSLDRVDHFDSLARLGEGHLITNSKQNLFSALRVDVENPIFAEQRGLRVRKGNIQELQRF